MSRFGTVLDWVNHYVDRTYGHTGMQINKSKYLFSCLNFFLNKEVKNNVITRWIYRHGDILHINLTYLFLVFKLPWAVVIATRHTDRIRKQSTKWPDVIASAGTFRGLPHRSYCSSKPQVVSAMMVPWSCLALFSSPVRPKCQSSIKLTTHAHQQLDLALVLNQPSCRCYFSGSFLWFLNHSWISKENDLHSFISRKRRFTWLSSFRLVFCWLSFQHVDVKCTIYQLGYESNRRFRLVMPSAHFAVSQEVIAILFDPLQSQTHRNCCKHEFHNIDFTSFKEKLANDFGYDLLSPWRPATDRHKHG